MSLSHSMKTPTIKYGYCEDLSRDQVLCCCTNVRVRVCVRVTKIRHRNISKTRTQWGGVGHRLTIECQHSRPLHTFYGSRLKICRTCIFCFNIIIKQSLARLKNDVKI